MDNPSINPSDSPEDRVLEGLDVNRALIDTLYADGFLDESAYNRALIFLIRQKHWWNWINRSLLFSGAALTLAGIVFFFAYNWSRLPSMAKFSIVEILLVGSLVAAWKVGLNR